MDERAALLHNMSGPPHTVLKYAGLGALAAAAGPGASEAKAPALTAFGTPVRVVLPAEVAGATPAEVLRRLGRAADAAPERALAALVDARAAQLPLPDGCVVIPARPEHPVFWPDDVLAALAVLAKSSGSVWLRARSPALSAALQRREATLLVPPRFAGALAEARR